jgi:hypothetical protein
MMSKGLNPANSYDPNMNSNKTQSIIVFGEIKNLGKLTQTAKPINKF